MLTRSITLHVLLTFSAIAVLPLVMNAQEPAKLKNIDLLVYMINATAFTAATDSSANDMPAYKIYMSMYETSISDGATLKKYTHRVLNFDNAQHIRQTGDYNSTFYYNQEHLIKVEESVTDKNGHFTMYWYFENEQLIHLLVQPQPQDNDFRDRMKDREQLLPELAKNFLDAFRRKHPST